MSRLVYLLILTALIAASCFSAGCTILIGDSSQGGSASQNSAPGISGSVSVIRIIDGDTLRVAFPDGSQETVRILGIDTPEKTVDGNDPGKFDDVCDAGILALWGEEASQYTTGRLDGPDITIATDRAAGTRDRYGRILAYITLPDGSDLGEELVEQGLARVYTPESFARKGRYLSVQQQAVQAGRGIWSGHAPHAGTPG